MKCGWQVHFSIRFPCFYDESREVEIYDLWITAHQNVFWDWTGRISQISFLLKVFKAHFVLLVVFSGTSPLVKVESSSSVVRVKGHRHKWPSLLLLPSQMKNTVAMVVIASLNIIT